jgi:hypothetical protein
MHRSPLARLLTVVFAAWFVTALAEPQALHTCAMHSAHAAAVGTTHHMHQAAGGHDHSTTPHRGEQCSCLGSCCSVVPVTLARSPELAWVPAQILLEQPLFAEVVFAPARFAHVLPFANGPPARV